MSEKINNKNIVVNEQYSNKSFRSSLSHDYKINISPNLVKESKADNILLENLTLVGQATGSIFLNETLINNTNISFSIITKMLGNELLIDGLTISHVTQYDTVLHTIDLEDTLLSNVNFFILEAFKVKLYKVFMSEVVFKDLKIYGLSIYAGTFNDIRIENAILSQEISIATTFNNLRLNNVLIENTIDISSSTFNGLTQLNNVKLEKGAKLLLPKGLDYKLDKERNITIIKTTKKELKKSNKEITKKNN